MGQLEDMQIFARVVEAGSITKAAEQLNMAKSAISKRLSTLESRLGIKLINRTTRTSSLTETGQQYYQRCKLIMDEVEELNSQAAQSVQTLKGHLNIAVPLSFGVEHLAPALDIFLQKHPELTLSVNLSDRKVDLIEQGLDLAFRIGELEDSSLQAKKIAPIRQILCASPEYLKQHGTPENIEQLKQHKILRYSGTIQSGISFTDKDNQTEVVHLDARVVANNGDFLKVFAESHHGIIYLPTFISWQSMANKQLVPLLKDYQTPTLNAYAVYPPNRHLPKKVRSLIDFVVEHFGETPYWDTFGS